MPRLRSSGGMNLLFRSLTKTTSSTAIDPEVGLSSPAIRPRVVDLPQPDGPRRVKNSPSLMVKVTSCRTVVPPKSLRRFLTTTSGIFFSSHEQAGDADEYCGDGD